MPQLDLTSYISQFFWCFVFFLYLYLYIHTNIIVVLIQILKTRHLKKKMDLVLLNKTNLYLKDELKKLELNFSLILKTIKFFNFLKLIHLNIFFKIRKFSNYSYNFFLKSMFNYLIIK